MILVFVETDAAGATEVSRETVTFARSLAERTGGPLHAVIVGNRPDGTVDQLGSYGVTEVHHATGDAVSEGLLEPPERASTRAGFQNTLSAYGGASWAAAVQAVAVDAGGHLTLHSLPELEVQADLQTDLLVQCAALAPSGDRIALGCSDGAVRLVAIEGFDAAPILVTATRTSKRTATRLQRLLGRSRVTHAYRCTCPSCRQSFELADDAVEQIHHEVVFHFADGRERRYALTYPFATFDYRRLCELLGVQTDARFLQATVRGYDAGRFSFNVKGGRCEACQGDGVTRVEMHLLTEVYVACDV